MPTASPSQRSTLTRPRQPRICRETDVKIGRAGDDDRFTGAYSRRLAHRSKERNVNQASGRSLDRVLKIEEGTGARPPIPLQRTMAMRAEAVTTVEPGLIELEAEVTLTASMK